MHINVYSCLNIPTLSILMHKVTGWGDTITIITIGLVDRGGVKVMSFSIASVGTQG